MQKRPPRRSLRDRKLLRQRHVPADRGARAPRPPARLCAASLRRRLRRRDRQLGVAASHRRLVVLPRVCRQGRQGRGLRGDNVPYHPRAPLAGLDGGDSRRRRLRHHLVIEVTRSFTREPSSPPRRRCTTMSSGRIRTQLPITKRSTRSSRRTSKIPARPGSRRGSQSSSSRTPWKTKRACWPI